MTVDSQVTREVINIITGSWRSQALYAAVKLGLPDVLEEGAMSPAAIAERTGTDEDGIRRLLRLLAAMNVVEESGSTYKNTPLSRALLDGPPFLREMCLLYGEEFYAAWAHAPEAIAKARSGFEIAFGRPFYSHLGDHPDTARRFQRTMNAGSMFFEAVPQAFDFSGKHVVDVGGGGGQLLATILQNAPDARGTLFDGAHMMPAARQHLSEAVGVDRVALEAGDMFQSVPTGGDVYIMCRVLAGWADSDVVTAFEHCRIGMRDQSSRLIVIDRLVDEAGSSVLPALWDLHLHMTAGGRHRTRQEFVGLLQRAGLTVERSVELPMENTALIAASTGAEVS